MSTRLIVLPLAFLVSFTALVAVSNAETDMEYLEREFPDHAAIMKIIDATDHRITVSAKNLLNENVTFYDDPLVRQLNLPKDIRQLEETFRNPEFGSVYCTRKLLWGKKPLYVRAVPINLREYCNKIAPQVFQKWIEEKDKQEKSFYRSVRWMTLGVICGVFILICWVLIYLFNYNERSKENASNKKTDQYPNITDRKPTDTNSSS